MGFHERVILPILDRLDSETMHIAVRETLHYAQFLPYESGLKLIERFTCGRERCADECLRTHVGALKLKNPFIVGAGWDKQFRAILGLGYTGVAGIEGGGVLPLSQYGNPKPRVFAKDNCVLNRLGFNSKGMDSVRKEVQRLFARHGDLMKRMEVVLGVNTALNRGYPLELAPLFHAMVIAALYPYASYFSLGISSPNTPGTRQQQAREHAYAIVRECNKAMDMLGGKKPLFMKIAPDLTFPEVDALIEVSEAEETGLIIGNTTIDHAIKARYGWGDQEGGFSGDDPEFQAMSVRIIKYVYRQTKGRIPIMGSGGVNGWQTALEKIGAGASAIQSVSGFRKVGLSLPAKINRGLAAYMEWCGVKHIEDLVGVTANGDSLF